MNARKAACSIAIILALMIALTGCYSPPPLPTATFEITEWTQTYYTYLWTYGYVYVYFKVTNTGAVYIDYCQLWIEVTCADGSKYQEDTWASAVPVGGYITDYTLINVSEKQAVSASITHYELTSY